MTYLIEIQPLADKKLKKIYTKNQQVYFSVIKKLDEIVNNPHSYKNLRGPLKGIKRVHIEKSFVLLFVVDYNREIISVIDFDHHDKIYK